MLPFANDQWSIVYVNLWKDLTALGWLRQEELQEVPPKNGYFQIDV